MCDTGHCDDCQQPNPITQVKVAIEQAKGSSK